jgi:hypothetical protein
LSLLLKMGADVTLTTDRGWTARELAERSGMLEAAAALDIVAIGPNVEEAVATASRAHLEGLADVVGRATKRRQVTRRAWEERYEAGAQAVELFEGLVGTSQHLHHNATALRETRAEALAQSARKAWYNAQTLDPQGLAAGSLYLLQVRNEGEGDPDAMVETAVQIAAGNIELMHKLFNALDFSFKDRIPRALADAMLALLAPGRPYVTAQGSKLGPLTPTSFSGLLAALCGPPNGRQAFPNDAPSKLAVYP